MGTHPIFESDFDCLTEKLMSSDSSSSDDDEMRKRLMETVVTASAIQKEVRVEKKRKEETNLVKVGFFKDIELSKRQIELLARMLAEFTDMSLEFREPKKKTNKRLEMASIERLSVANHRLVPNGALIDLAEPVVVQRKRRRKADADDNEAKLREIAVTLDQVKCMV